MRDDLRERLAEQVRFLVRSAAAFDEEDDEAESLRISTVIRTLVHDTAMSHALLVQMQVRDSIPWASVVEMPAPPKVAFSTATLWYIDIGHGYGARIGGPWHELSFDTWWQEPFDSSGFTRRNLVEYGANKDGGAHVARELPSKFEQPTRSNSLGHFYQGSTAIESFHNPFLAGLRTMADELLTTLRWAGLTR